MKILESTDYSDWTLKFTCPKCDTQLQVEPEDVKGHFHEGSGCDPREYYAEYYTYSVNCPVCNLVRSISEKDMPKLLVVDIQKRTMK